MDPLTTDWLIRQTGCRPTIKIISTSNIFNTSCKHVWKCQHQPITKIFDNLIINAETGSPPSRASGLGTLTNQCFSNSRSTPQVLPCLLKPLVPKHWQIVCKGIFKERLDGWLWPILWLCVSCQKFATLALTSYKLWDRRRHVLSLRRDRNRSRTSKE